MLRAIHQALAVRIGILADAHATGTVNGPTVDARAYDEALLVINMGDEGAAGTLVVKVQEGDASDGSDATDIAGATTATLADAGKNKHYAIRIRAENAKRYLRAVAVVAVNAVDFGCSWLLSRKHGTMVQDNAAHADVGAVISIDP